MAYVNSTLWAQLFHFTLITTEDIPMVNSCLEMFNITSYQWSADQNHSELYHLTPIKMAWLLSKIYCVCVCVCVCCFIAESYLTLCDRMDCSPPGFSVCGDSSGKNTGVGCHALLQGIFPIQGSNQVSGNAGKFFTLWTTREAQEYWNG